MHISALKQSKYLSRHDVAEGVEATIKGIDQANVALESEPPELKFILHFAENLKPMVLNTTNAQLIAAVLKSEETDEWIGKRISLYDDPTVSFAGKLVGGIRVRAVTTSTPTGPKPATATDKTRMWALNLLEAAPGQKYRQIVTGFLEAKEWIMPGTEAETWNLETVPTSKQACTELAELIQSWSDGVPF